MLVTMIPNIISVSRVLLMPAIVFLLAQASISAFLTALILFTLAALTDFWDGLLARRLGVSSKLGAFIDPLADKILVLGVLAAFVYHNILPLGLFLIFATRDIFMTALRSIVSTAGVQWQTSQLAKWKTFLQFLVLYGGFIVMGTRVKFFTLPIPLVQNLFLWIVWPIALLTLYSALDYLLIYQSALENMMVYKNSYTRNTTLTIATLGLAWVQLPAPGTIASAAAACLAWGLPLQSTWAGLAIAILAIIGWISATQAAHILDNQDPSIVVIDEVVAMLFVCFWLQPTTWVGYLIGFLFFRFFDIIKPFPINIIEQKIKGGLGIMLDDLAAAALAVAATKIVLSYLAIH